MSDAHFAYSHRYKKLITMRRMRRMFVLSIVLISACDSGDARTSGASNGATNGTGGNHDLGPGPLEVDDLSVNRDAFFEQDPPLMYCGLDGGAFVAPSPPGGTLNCPDDKNLEGCPCPQEGMMAACWPGKRVNRGLGVCMDGMTTCTKATEIATTWGPCMGAVLPTPGATDGAEACKCFSHGLWDVDNISPCGVGPSDTMVTSMYSSSAPPSPNPSPSAINCNNMTPTAANIWAHDTVTADCQGHFTLCYTLKAGDAMNKKTTDCVVQKICTTGDYTQVNMAQSWQPLPGWTSPASASACTTAFFNTGGYGEMSVSGETLTCDQLADHVFQTVTYCKTGDANCVSGGGGQF
jgi:hypothetical protein